MSVILRVRATLTYGSGGPGVHTSYWNPGTPGGSLADANDVTARVRAALAIVAPQYPTTTSIQVQSDVAFIEATTGALVTQNSATPVGSVTGSGGASSGALATMVLARLRTNVVFNDRLIRGRWYMGPVIPGAVSTTGQTAAGTITAFNNMGSSLLGAGATASALVVWRRPGASAGAPAIVTGISTWESLATLRSRRDP